MGLAACARSHPPIVINPYSRAEPPVVSGVGSRQIIALLHPCGKGWLSRQMPPQACGTGWPSLKVLSQACEMDWLSRKDAPQACGTGWLSRKDTPQACGKGPLSHNPAPLAIIMRLGWLAPVQMGWIRTPPAPKLAKTGQVRYKCFAVGFLM